MVTALVLLNLAGGDAVNDLEILEKDAGLGQVLRKVERHRLPRQERQALERRWRNPRPPAAPSGGALGVSVSTSGEIPTAMAASPVAWCASSRIWVSGGGASSPVAPASGGSPSRDWGVSSG